MLLKELADFNNKNDGIVESYIYRQLKLRLGMVHEAFEYIKKAKPGTFSLEDFISRFAYKPGLRRSIDKAYEIIVYALFSTIVRALNVQVSLSVKNLNKEVLTDFDKFVELVLGLSKSTTTISLPAKLYRVGATNAADRGLDMWSNFGPAVQVKHLSLSKELAEDVSETISADKIIIVCLDGDAKIIEIIMKQLPFSQKIQGIITFTDLETWYALCLSKKYKKILGDNLLNDLLREFSIEFPVSNKIEPFLVERKYNTKTTLNEWQV